MKRVFPHPPAPTSGRRYWRSTDELADTPEFREWLEREFPSSAAQLNGDEWSRRSFLKLMGASVALAGFGVLRKKMGDGAGLAFLVEETHSPTRERMRGELEKMFPRMRWCVYDPLRSEAQNFATQISFGDNLRLVPRVERADVILALDSD